MLRDIFYDIALEGMAELMEQLDADIMARIIRRIALLGSVSETTRWEIEIVQQAGLLYDDVVRIVAQNTGKAEREIELIFREAGVESVEFDNAIYSAAGLSPQPIRTSPEMTQILKAGIVKTNGLVRNLTMTTAITSQQTYIDACTRGYMQVVSGAISYTDAISSMVRLAAARGTRVLYPSGHIDQLDVAVRRAVLTGVSQTAGVIAERNAELMGCDLMEISAHPGARPSHAVWQGKIVSLSGRKGYLSKADIGYGTVTGFKGANCRHDWYPFFEGISERAYTDAQLKDYRDDDLYQRQQEQRRQERNIRKERRKLVGINEAMKESDGEVAEALRKEFTRGSVRLKKKEAALREYCRSNGLLYDSSRVQTAYGNGTTQGFGRSVSQKAVWANKKAQKKS